MNTEPAVSKPGDKIVNICMVTYNRVNFTKAAIGALVTHTAHPHVLTVVDNGSGDETPEYLKKLHDKGIINNLILLRENVGIARASNLAWLQEPDAEYYLKLDNDIAVEKAGWLEAMVEVAEAFPEAGMVGYSFEEESYPVEVVRGYRIRRKHGTLGGACVLIPRRVFEKLGFWCEDYGLYGEEDCDYGFRVANAGLWNIYLEDETIGLHLPGGRAAMLDAATFFSKKGPENMQEEEYRRWKDNERAKAKGKGGMFETNVRRYCADRESLRYSTGWRKTAAGGAGGLGWKWARPLAVKAGNLPKVVAFMPKSVDGCGYYRMALPAEHLRAGYPEFCVRMVTGVDFHVTLAADGIIFQRQLAPAYLEYMKARQKLGRAVGYELDDNFDEIPPHNPNFPMTRLKDGLYAILRQANFCVFSTSGLREYYQRKLSLDGDRCHVLPNYIDAQAYGQRPVGRTDGEIRIGYAGSITHERDFQLCVPALKNLAKQHPGRLKLVVLGWTRELAARAGLLAIMPVEIHDEAPILEYAKKLTDLDLDIGLAPLEDNEFNRCKSNIKLLEYGSAGMAVVASDVVPYRFIQTGVQGLLARNPVEWEKHLDQLIQDHELRRRLAINLNALVREKYDISSHVQEWAELFRKVLRGNG
ncbi:MAG: glycosyltransferase [Verrucomicrobiae bacterium]|nr:glycosyltransferase [Verrucomicrobiae bacterium]